MTPKFRLTLLWLVASLVALAVALAPVVATFVDGEYVPVGPDGFYHARRILDTVGDSSAFFQFDTRTHAPDGSLVTWPWAYDFAMSLIVRVAVWLHLGASPMSVLVHLPPFAFPVALLLMLWICRSLGLGIATTGFALFATAAFPLSQSLYSIGNIDHHFAEHLFVLGTLAAALHWLRAPASRATAIVAGITFGLATGVHSALFALQLPLLATLFVTWLRREPLPAHARAFAASLVLAQLAVALPSLALQRGAFDYYTLSWFQVYVAACTATVVILLASLRRDARGFIVLAAVALLLLIPTVRQVLHARDFFTNSIAGMADISEVRSLLTLWQDMRSFTYVASLYTWLVALLPATVALCAWRLWRAREAADRHFWIASLAGIALLLAQLRLQYFGSFALYLPWLVVLHEWTRAHPRHAYAAAAAVALVFAAVYLPGLRSHVFARHILSGDPTYAVTREVYAPLARACRTKPGTVLANPYDGHYIRFHSDCSVIANNFLVTPADVNKVLEEQRLLALPASAIATAAPGIDYVFVRSASLFFVDTTGTLVMHTAGYTDESNYPLVRELLNAPAEQLPAGFRLVYELKPAAGAPAYARLFAIERDVRAAPGA